MSVSIQPEYSQTLSGFPQHPTNGHAFSFVLFHHAYRVREVERIVLLGLGNPGDPDKQRANYSNWQLEEYDRYTQEVSITQLGIALQIQRCIREQWPSNASRNVYVCDPGLTEETKARLRELQIREIRQAEIRNYINQNTLVYDVTMLARELRRTVQLSPRDGALPPAVVIAPMFSVLDGNFQFDR
ncbi:hypothetical protein N8I77_001058 [Diaporthe amygdali]|uniref:SRR1-like domain-containing protein n=1 Tax=Phomopsis amygdali TaxID=1214568 RepID=A0AAD9SRB0_PHOAM|nr:hypothetical protein N8I77_001058 [Diaporthe amygdali]